MDVIDEEGNLFGVVNIIDALVVLFVVAVVAAGVALVLGTDDDPAAEPAAETVHVTLDLGSLPDYLVQAIEEGDTAQPDGDSTLTITDLHFAPEDNGTRVYARVALSGPPNGEVVTFDGAPPRLGRTLEIVTDRYEVHGRVQAIGGDDALERDTTRVVLHTRLDRAGARSLTSGDELRVAGRPVATVEDVAAYPADDGDVWDVYYEAALRTIHLDGEPRLGDTPVRRGQTIPLPGEDGGPMRATVERVDGGLERTTVEAVVAGTMDRSAAGRLTAGGRVGLERSSVATVERVWRYRTLDPDQERVLVGVTLETVTFDGEPRFGEAWIGEGRSLTLRGDGYRLEGQLDRVGALELPGSSETVTATLAMYGVREHRAEGIRSGMRERGGDGTVARVTDVSVEPSVVVVPGESGELGVYDHPYERDVMLTVDLSVRRTEAGLRFRGEPIRQGEALVLDFGETVVRADLVEIQ